MNWASTRGLATTPLCGDSTYRRVRATKSNARHGGCVLSHVGKVSIISRRQTKSVMLPAAVTTTISLNLVTNQLLPAVKYARLEATCLCAVGTNYNAVSKDGNSFRLAYG